MMEILTNDKTTKAYRNLGKRIVNKYTGGLAWISDAKMISKGNWEIEIRYDDGYLETGNSKEILKRHYIVPDNYRPNMDHLEERVQALLDSGPLPYRYGCITEHVRAFKDEVIGEMVEDSICFQPKHPAEMWISLWGFRRKSFDLHVKYEGGYDVAAKKISEQLHQKLKDVWAEWCKPVGDLEPRTARTVLGAGVEGNEGDDPQISQILGDGNGG